MTDLLSLIIQCNNHISHNYRLVYHECCQDIITPKILNCCISILAKNDCDIGNSILWQVSRYLMLNLFNCPGSMQLLWLPLTCVGSAHLLGSVHMLRIKQHRFQFNNNVYIIFQPLIFCFVLVTYLWLFVN